MRWRFEQWHRRFLRSPHQPSLYPPPGVYPPEISVHSTCLVSSLSIWWVKIWYHRATLFQWPRSKNMHTRQQPLLWTVDFCCHQMLNHWISFIYDLPSWISPSRFPWNALISTKSFCSFIIKFVGWNASVMVDTFSVFVLWRARCFTLLLWVTLTRSIT
jgi:hypothetical protein